MIDFNNIQKYRENNRIEAKLALGGLPCSIWETYSSFANTMGGLILLGVEERKDKSLHPVNLPDPQKLVDEFWDLINDKSKVSANILSPRNVSIESVDGNNIIIIEVPRAGRFQRPVYINGDAYKGSYRRNGEGDYRCTAEEIASMLRDAEIMTVDTTVIESLGLECIDFDCVKRYREELSSYRSNYVPKDIDRLGFLERMGAAHGGHPTVSGLLMFGKLQYIKQQFPSFSLRFTSYGQSFSTEDGDEMGNLYDFYRRVKSVIGVKNAKYPISVKYALLEAVSNAITNADYYGNCGISVFFGEQAIVITNPGGFRINLKGARSGGVSDPRNSSLIKMLTVIGGGERMGSGIPEIFSVWKKEGWSEPLICERYDPLRTTVYLPLNKCQRTEGVCQIYTAENKKEAEIRSAYGKSLIIEHLTYFITATEEELSLALFIGREELSALAEELVYDDILVCVEACGQKQYKLKD